MKMTLEYYRTLPYSRRVEGFQEAGVDRYWLAWIEELPGCKTDGATFDEAMANLDVAFDDYIEAMLEFGTEIAVPEKLSATVTVHEIPATEILDAPFLKLEGDLTQEPELSSVVQRWGQADYTSTATKTEKLAAQIRGANLQTA